MKMWSCWKQLWERWLKKSSLDDEVKGDAKQIESNVTGETEEEKENSQQNTEQKFKYDKCGYSAKRKATLEKYINTKHVENCT